MLLIETVRYVEIHAHHRNALLAQQNRRRFDGHDPKFRYSSEQTLRPEAASGPYIRCFAPDPARRPDVQRLQHAVLDPTPILRPEIEKIRELPFVLFIGIPLIRPEASASVDVRMLRVHCQHSICRSGTCTFQLMIVPCHSRIGHGQRLIQIRNDVVDVLYSYAQTQHLRAHPCEGTSRIRQIPVRGRGWMTGNPPVA